MHVVLVGQNMHLNLLVLFHMKKQKSKYDIAFEKGFFSF